RHWARPAGRGSTTAATGRPRRRPGRQAGRRTLRGRARGAAAGIWSLLVEDGCVFDACTPLVGDGEVRARDRGPAVFTLLVHGVEIELELRAPALVEEAR